MIRLRNSIACIVLAVAMPLAGLAVAEGPSNHGMPTPPMPNPKLADAVSKQMADMKMMAADPAKASEMAKDAAMMMTMHKMAMSMAADPKCQAACKETMADPAMKKVHEDAMKMTADPEQAKAMEDKIMADPMMMKMVMHMAMQMQMAPGMAGHGMMDHGMMDHGMKPDAPKMGGMMDDKK